MEPNPLMNPLMEPIRPGMYVDPLRVYGPSGISGNLVGPNSSLFGE